MLHFYMFVPTNATVKLDNENIGYAQGIGIILCRFNNCPIRYPVGTVYYYLVHPSNTISKGAIKFYVGFQNVTYEAIEYCDFFDPQSHSWRSPNQTKKRLLSNKKCQSQPSKRTQLYVPYQSRIYLGLFIRNLVMSLLTG